MRRTKKPSQYPWQPEQGNLAQEILGGLRILRQTSRHNLLFNCQRTLYNASILCLLDSHCQPGSYPLLTNGDNVCPAAWTLSALSCPMAKASMRGVCSSALSVCDTAVMF